MMGRSSSQVRGPPDRAFGPNLEGLRRGFRIKRSVGSRAVHWCEEGGHVPSHALSGRPPPPTHVEKKEASEASQALFGVEASLPRPALCLLRSNALQPCAGPWSASRRQVGQLLLCSTQGAMQPT